MVATNVSSRGEERRLGWSSITAGIGDGVVAVALPLLAAKATADPLRVASVIAAQHLPWVLVSLGWRRVAGDRRTVLGLVDTTRAMILGLLGLAVVLGHDSLTMIQVAAFAVGLGEALTDSAETETDDVTGLSTRGMVGLAVVGLPLGGALYEIFPATPFLFDVLAFTLASMFALVVTTPHGAPPVEESLPLVPAMPPAARLTIAAVTTASLAASAVLGVLVLFALRDLGLGAPAFGLLLAGLAAAATVGGLVAPEIGHVLGIRTGLIVALAFGAAGDLAAALVADVRLPWLSAGALGVTAAAGMVVAVLGRAQLQRVSGTAPLPAVLGLLHLLSWAAIPVGALAGGLVARQTSVATAVVASAGVWLVGAALASSSPVGALQKSS
ncbi:MAG: MFS transporter [Acidobacteria bacterium]|nr:MFS transporter [Acidobacteriota bacterium]